MMSGRRAAGPENHEDYASSRNSLKQRVGQKPHKYACQRVPRSSRWADRDFQIGPRVICHSCRPSVARRIIAACFAAGPSFSARTTSSRPLLRRLSRNARGHFSRVSGIALSKPHQCSNARLRFPAYPISGIHAGSACACAGLSH
jgi:hypothetical protein